MALSLGLGLLGWVLRQSFRGSRTPPPVPTEPEVFYAPPLSSLVRPTLWLAIRNRSLRTVQTAFGLRDARPCSWLEGLTSGERLFISPPVKGWVLVFGTELPDPGADVDLCYRFLANMSRKLGRIQYFWCDRVFHYHGWVIAERGKILRAYAWGGRTLWKQGTRTPAERDLNLRCLDYGEEVERTFFGESDWNPASNQEKVPALAAQWSLDPARVDETLLAPPQQGLAGQASLRY
jgi:hypothetical protein